MKNGIHPEYRVVTVTCACGETFLTRSTRSDLRLEICSKCHPFFTGKQKLVDSAGRVERFERRYARSRKAAARAAADGATDPDGSGATGTPPGGSGPTGAPPGGSAPTSST